MARCNVHYCPSILVHLAKTFDELKINKENQIRTMSMSSLPPATAEVTMASISCTWAIQDLPDFKTVFLTVSSLLFTADMRSLCEIQMRINSPMQVGHQIVARSALILSNSARTRGSPRLMRRDIGIFCPFCDAPTLLTITRCG